MATVGARSEAVPVDARQHETLSCLRDISCVFRDDSDERSIERTRDKAEALQAEFDEQEKEARRLIRALSQRVDLLDEKSKQSDRISRQRSRARNLEEEREQLDGAMTQLERDVVTRDCELEEWVRREQKLLEKENLVASDEKHEVPRLEKTLSLYYHITRIQWKKSASSSNIQGYICKPTEARPLEIDPSESDPFAIANQIWRQIGEL